MTQRFSSDDESYMQHALALAVRGLGRVEPNPMVGCVIVRRGKIVGRGYHRMFGGAHAEINALKNAGVRAQGATAYITLEPCCHHGKTPPCTDAVIAAGIKKVIAATPDPFTQVRNKGLGQLKAAGIKVSTGLCREQAAGLNAPYFKLQHTKLPWVILKWAQSLDGKIATRKGDSKWISCLKSREHAHRIRSRVDAVLVGVQTVITDDPMLNCRHGQPRRMATRLIIDPQLRTPLQAKVIKTARKIPTIIAADRRITGTQKTRKYQRAGAEVMGISNTKNGLNLKQLLKALGKQDMTNIMVEGGGKTLGSFVDAGLADEAIIFVAPRLIGGKQAPAPLDGVGPAAMDQALVPIETKASASGCDTVYHLLLSNPLEYLR